MLAITLFKYFSRRLITLESTRKRVELVFLKKQLSLSDVGHIYTGLFLDIFSEYEALIEKLFLGLLARKYFSHTQKIRLKVKITPLSSIKTVVFGGKPYVDWLPYRETLKRAKIFFEDQKPFSALDDTDKSNLERYQKIRNAMAHKSEKAKSDFLDMLSGVPLLPIEKTPTGYLRSKPNPGQTQFEIISFQLATLSRKLCQ